MGPAYSRKGLRSQPVSVGAHEHGLNGHDQAIGSHAGRPATSALLEGAPAQEGRGFAGPRLCWAADKEKRMSNLRRLVFRRLAEFASNYFLAAVSAADGAIRLLF